MQWVDQVWGFSFLTWHKQWSVSRKQPPEWQCWRIERSFLPKDRKMIPPAHGTAQGVSNHSHIKKGKISEERLKGWSLNLRKTNQILPFHFAKDWDDVKTWETWETNKCVSTFWNHHDVELINEWMDGWLVVELLAFVQIVTWMTCLLNSTPSFSLRFRYSTYRRASR